LQGHQPSAMSSVLASVAPKCIWRLGCALAARGAYSALPDPSVGFGGWNGATGEYGREEIVEMGMVGEVKNGWERKGWGRGKDRDRERRWCIILLTIHQCWQVCTRNFVFNAVTECVSTFFIWLFILFCRIWPGSAYWTVRSFCGWFVGVQACTDCELKSNTKSIALH